MELSKEKQRELALKLQRSRLRLLDRQPFYGLLLLYMKFSLDLAAKTAYTDGERIAFQPEFLEKLTKEEVDYVLMHEVLHTALSHVERGTAFENKEVFNYASDIVVNSTILHSNNGDLSSITVDGSEAMHNLPDGREGYAFSAEEIYPIVLKLMQSGKLKYEDLTSKRKRKGKVSVPPKNKSLLEGRRNGEPWDNHDKWREAQNDDAQERQNLWLNRMVNATELINSMAVNIEHADIRCGSIPAFMERLLKELRESQLDWRTILQNFIQEDVTDYTFSPPDRRFSESPFFLPDFNEKDESVKNVLFMIDTSGSMSDDMVLDAFSEVKGAVDQFDGKLAGYLGFFDAVVYEPLAFDDVGDLLGIRPKGGGGTNFGIIFDYVRNNMNEPPSTIIILTDGYAKIPREDTAQGIPVLWLINNEHVTPEWGKIARIKP